MQYGAFRWDTRNLHATLGDWWVVLGAHTPRPSAFHVPLLMFDRTHYGSALDGATIPASRRLVRKLSPRQSQLN